MTFCHENNNFGISGYCKPTVSSSLTNFKFFTIYKILKDLPEETTALYLVSIELSLETKEQEIPLCWLIKNQ